MATTEELQGRTVRYFCDRSKNFPIGRPYNCCESVLLALKDRLGAGSEIIPKVGTGIGAGVALNGLLCGAVSSVAIAIGMKYGRTSPEENPQPVWNIVDKYMAEFEDKFGYVNCRQLTGQDLKTGGRVKGVLHQDPRLRLCGTSGVCNRKSLRNTQRIAKSRPNLAT